LDENEEAMPRVWLRQNYRVTLFVGVGLAIFAVVMALMAAGIITWLPAWARLVFGALSVICALLIVAVALVGSRPRLAYRDHQLVVNLRLGIPSRIPIEFVEAFLLGQLPAQIPGDPLHQTEARSLNIRLADRAEAWHQQETHPALGKWCGGYISISGTWCEPLSLDLVHRLNQWLSEAHAALPTAALRAPTARETV
jgi:hypothetical protein